MKHLLLALLFVTFLGWHTVLTSDCNMEKTEPCIRSALNCPAAKACYAITGGCERTDECMFRNEVCQSTTNAIKRCFSDNCSEPYNFAKLIKEQCMAPLPSAGVAALTGFAAMTVCFLTYFFIV